MNFKDVININKIGYDGYGAPVVSSSLPMKCLITEQRIKNDDSSKEYYVRRYDLKALVRYKSFEPYSTALVNENITVTFESRNYKINSISVIRKNSKPLYYELAMDLI